MVTVVRNGHGDKSSNPGREYRWDPQQVLPLQSVDLEIMVMKGYPEHQLAVVCEREV